MKGGCSLIAADDEHEGMGKSRRGLRGMPGVHGPCDRSQIRPRRSKVAAGGGSTPIDLFGWTK